MAHTTNELETTRVSMAVDRILVVDDEGLIRDSLSEYLKSEGFVCETAGTGREALEKLVSRNFTLVVTDIQMPHINGFQLLEHLSRNFPQVAVMMITGQPDVESAVQAMQQGACDYITKPFNLGRVLDKVNRALHNRLLLLEKNQIVQHLEKLVGRKSCALPLASQDLNSSLSRRSRRRTTSPFEEECMLEVPRRKLAAIMFTDIVGYSALTQRSEDLALKLLEEHRKLLRSIFSKHRGKEIKTMGDAFLIVFGSALEAVRCAIEIQMLLAQRNSTVPAEKRIQIRIGVHLGDVVYQDDDIYGNGVNIASGIEPLAEPAGICISEDLAHQIHNKIQEPIVRLGKSYLKNLQMPVDVYKIVLPFEKDLSPFSEIPPQSQRSSTAVFPFVNTSPDPENGHFNE